MLLTRANTLPQSPLGVCVRAHPLSRVQLFATLWTVACQAPLSMEFSRQKYWSGLPLPLPRDPPNPGTGPTLPASPALADGFFTTEPPGKPPTNSASEPDPRALLSHISALESESTPLQCDLSKLSPSGPEPSSQVLAHPSTLRDGGEASEQEDKERRDAGEPSSTPPPFPRSSWFSGPFSF